MAGIGHNNGPTMEKGQAMRAFQWRKAQEALMPKALPLMVIKMRVKRAAELGMDYKTYASIRQYSGSDILGLLFSSNALRIIGNGARMPEAEERVLAQVKSARKLSLVHLPNRPEAVALMNPVLDATAAAPRFTDTWRQTRDRLEGFIRAQALPGGRVVIIGDAPLEAEWVTAARAAGYLPSDRYFTHQSA